MLIEGRLDGPLPNWDAYAAAPGEEAFFLAYRFLEPLPLGAPAPSVGAEADGHVTLEWHRSPRRTLSVSVSAQGDLHYAARLGPSRCPKRSALTRPVIAA